LPLDGRHIFNEAEISKSTMDIGNRANEPEGTEELLRVGMHYAVVHYFILEDCELGLCGKRSVYEKVGSF